MYCPDYTSCHTLLFTHWIFAFVFVFLPFLVFVFVFVFEFGNQAKISHLPLLCISNCITFRIFRTFSGPFCRIFLENLIDFSNFFWATTLSRGNCLNNQTYFYLDVSFKHKHIQMGVMYKRTRLERDFLCET